MCTRMFWSDNGQARVCSRTMDWEFSDEPQLWAFPRGLARTSHGIDENPLTWTSRYGNVALSAWDQGTSDGLNERGLAAHTLYLGGAGYELRDARPGVSNLLWSQYLLDSFATVSEALEGLRDVQIVSVLALGAHHGMHMAIEDAGGDSAVIEFLGGRPVVHHGPQYTVLTNDPPYDEQLAHLTRYRPFGGELPPPGDITSLDRFVRASYFLHYLPRPETHAEAVAGVVKLARNVAVPDGAPDDDLKAYPTGGSVPPTSPTAFTTSNRRAART
jgi:choloylglycine hydrolase